MALLFSDGCDPNTITNALQGKYQSSTNLPANSATTGRFGGSSWVNFGSFIPVTKTFGPATGGRVLGGFWINVDTAGTADMWPAAFYNSAKTQTGVAVGIKATTGTLFVSAWNNPTVAAVSDATAGRIIDSNWHWVEYDILFNDSGHAYVYVDGTQVINFTGDLNNAGTVSVERMTVAGQNGRFAMDDVCVYDDSGSGNFVASSFPIGPMKCQVLVPTSDVSVAWTRSTGSTNYTLVDEALDGTQNRITVVDYVSSSTVAQTDLYGYADLSGSPAAIKAVVLTTVAQNAAAGFGTLKHSIKSGGTVYDGQTYQPVSATADADAIFYVWEKDPATSANWTSTNVNALQAGVTVVTAP
jgi:hypothetical protein